MSIRFLLICLTIKLFNLNWNVVHLFKYHNASHMTRIGKIYESPRVIDRGT